MDWKDDIDIYRSALALNEAIDGSGEQARIMDLAGQLARQVAKSVEDDALLAGEFSELEREIESPDAHDESEPVGSGLEGILKDDGSVYQPGTGYLVVSYLDLSDPTIEVFRFEPTELAELVERIRSEHETSDISTQEISSESPAGSHVRTFHTLEEFEESDIGKGFLASSDGWVDVSDDAKLDDYLASIEDKEAAAEHDGAEHPYQQAVIDALEYSGWNVQPNADGDLYALTYHSAKASRTFSTTLDLRGKDIDDPTAWIDAALATEDQSLISWPSERRSIKKVRESKIWNISDRLSKEIPELVREAMMSVEPRGYDDNLVRDWYMRNFPDDELGKHVNPELTFDDALDAVSRGPAFYDALGVDDSVVRERVFGEIAARSNVSYDDVYDAWLNREHVPVGPYMEQKGPADSYVWNNLVDCVKNVYSFIRAEGRDASYQIDIADLMTEQLLDFARHEADGAGVRDEFEELLRRCDTELDGVTCLDVDDAVDAFCKDLMGRGADSHPQESLESDIDRLSDPSPSFTSTDERERTTDLEPGLA